MPPAAARSSLDLLSLHYRDSRRTEFKAEEEIFFNRELKSWFVFKPELVIDLLRDDERLLAPESVSNIKMLEARYKRQFPNIIFAMQSIPLLLNGQVHHQTRRSLAEIISAGRARTLAAMPELMARHIVPLDQEGNAEWVAARLAPLVSEALGLMCNCPQPLPYPKLALTRMFDRFVGLSALDEAEKQVGQLRRVLAETAPDADQAHVVALLVLGRDSLLSTLATALHEILRANQGERFADIEFPEFPPETGVAVAERVAAVEITVGSQTIAVGDRVRMYFQPISDMDSTNKQALFGAGAHSCLGRPISLDVWRTMIETFKGFTSRLISVACEYESNTMFTIPQYLRTEHTR